MHDMGQSRDGFQWDAQNGMRPGLPTLGHVEPSSNIKTEDQLYDVIVIGAGYAGLTAARDLTNLGRKVMLLEARDRIGGRTWSSNIDGYPYELGGTWVHWNQPFVWRELSRYKMQDEIENSHDLTRGVNSWTLVAGGQRKTFTRQEEAQMTSTAMQKFVNVDGNQGRTILPIPHQPFHNPDFAKFEKMSFQDRFDQMHTDLTSDERACLEGFLSITSGGQLQDSSFGEMLRWWALNGYDMQLYMEMCLTYKLKKGQSHFARKFFDEAQSTKNLDYAFNCPVSSVNDNSETVTVTTEAGSTFHGRKLICTVPLNVLADIEFSPPLHQVKLDTSRTEHVNQVSKVHVACANPELRSFSGTIASPHSRLSYMFGDGTTPKGETHLVSFGSSFKGVHLDPEDSESITLAALREFVAPEEEMTTMKPTKVVFHNWSRDRFAKGAWEWLRPGMMQSMHEMRAAQGNNVHFASADWAHLWRGFIDGAIEDGTRVAVDVHRELATA